MIAPLAEADIDIFAVLDPEYYSSDGQAALLDRVKRALRKTYTKTPEISRNGQAVTIIFTDFRVDVVPAFNRRGGGYLIPDSVHRRWIETDPTRHITIWTEENKAHDTDLVPLLKMLKRWNKYNGESLGSFHLEALGLQILKGVTISSFASGLRYVFDKSRSQFKYVIDPAGYGGNLADYLNSNQKVDDVSSRLETAYSRSLSAEELEARGKTEEAFEKWRLIFGDYFPAYG
jgi:hypothetical protein